MRAGRGTSESGGKPGKPRALPHARFCGTPNKFGCDAGADRGGDLQMARWVVEPCCWINPAFRESRLAAALERFPFALHLTAWHIKPEPVQRLTDREII